MRNYGAAFLLLTAIANAQSPSFEVASVKPNASGSDISTGSGLHNSRYSVENASLRSVFGTAFGMPRSRIAGPDWIDAERFDIEAKAAADTPDKELPLMLQTLLTERFHAATHRETREMPAYDMVVAKDGLKVALYDVAHPPSRTGRANFSGIGSMANLADQLASAVGQSVIDRTGAEGRYAYALSYAPLSAGKADDPNRPDIFTAVQQQLGVRLVARKQPIELLVIDHLDRPTEN
jgi:uncharacterized protein (TIGR03435 family)